MSLQVLQTCVRSQKTLAQLLADVPLFPQVLLNVRVRQKTDLATIPAVAAAIARVEARVHGQGRVLIRYSGTEPLIRLLIEGRDVEYLEAQADKIASAILAQIG